MAQNQLLLMCKLDGCFLAVIITKEKLGKGQKNQKGQVTDGQKPNRKPTGWISRNQRGGDESILK